MRPVRQIAEGKECRDTDPHGTSCHLKNLPNRIYAWDWHARQRGLGLPGFCTAAALGLSWALLDERNASQGAMPKIPYRARLIWRGKRAKSGAASSMNKL
jgi:hypothetical protein